MSTKKPASLSASLLSNRPRKGEAKPQSEQQAAQAKPEVAKLAVVEKQSKKAAPKSVVKPRRRSRTTPFSMQMNLKVRPEDRERFIAAAEKADLINGEFFSMLLDSYEATGKDT